MVAALKGRDYSAIMGMAMILAATVPTAEILTNATYGLLKPRIAYKEESGSA